MIMYIKIIGSLIIVVCTTLLGVDFANGVKKRILAYKYLSDYFSIVAERIKCGNSSITDILSECAVNYDGALCKLVNEFVNSLTNSDNTYMKDAIQKCFENDKTYRNSIEGEYMLNFACEWDAAGAAGGIKCAEKLSDQGDKKHKELMENSKTEAKLYVYSGAFAGVFTVLMLI